MFDGEIELEKPSSLLFLLLASALALGIYAASVQVRATGTPSPFVLAVVAVGVGGLFLPVRFLEYEEVETVWSVGVALAVLPVGALAALGLLVALGVAFADASLPTLPAPVAHFVAGSFGTGVSLLSVSHAELWRKRRVDNPGEPSPWQKLRP